jgi:beta-galactosidase
MTWKLLTFFAVALVLTGGTDGRAQQTRPADLIRNGDFERGAEGWGDVLRMKGVSVPKAEGNSWLALESYCGLSQKIALDGDWLTLIVSMRMRVTGVVLGKEGWQDARLAMEFRDANDRHVDPWPSVFHAEGSSDWVRYERKFPIPPGAATLTMGPAMFGSSGKAEFDDISVTVARRRNDPKQDAPLPKGMEERDLLGSSLRQGDERRPSGVVCLNGLWRFMPVLDGNADRPPGDGQGWGWFKVPGVWPRTATGGAQEMLLADDPAEADLGRMDQAWYRRTVTVPASWAGRRVLIDFTMVQTHARVLIDGKDAGEVFFPGGRLDVTKLVQPGKAQTLAILVTARPLEKESNVFMAPDRVITSKAAVGCKGLTGDVLLVGEPAQDAVGDVHVITSTRSKTITLDVKVLRPGGGQRRLAARILEAGKEAKSFQGEAFDASALKDGRISFSAPWDDAKLWDTDSPRNVYEAVVTLTDGAGKVLDESAPVRFGFREFWIDGRDFYLNGKRIHLRAIHTANIADPADRASLAGCRNTCDRLKAYGFNFLITSNYSFGPGEVSHMDGLFQAADEAGVLCSFTLPHGKDFNWKLDTPQQAERFRHLTEWLIRRAQNHPSIVLYAMNHNATGYHGDQNPLKMDGVYSPDDPATKGQPRNRTREQALLAADIARRLDPTRPVYHHQSGNLGELYTVNIYLNWSPRQERSDWLEHWSQKGVKPLFFVEWGLPHISSWSSYRGPEFIWGCKAYQQIWDSEFAAAYLGQEAYRMTPTKVKSMALEEAMWARGEPFAWSSLIQHLSTQDENYTQVQALFVDDNWRSHRTWGISAMLPWDQGNLWRTTRDFKNQPSPAEAFRGIGGPGIVPDAYLPNREWIYSMDANGIVPSILGKSFLRWNMPLCAYLGGGPERFTEKGHIFLPGQQVRKQLVLINDTRQEVSCRYSWVVESTDLKSKGAAQVAVPPGDKAMVPVSVDLPAEMRPGRYVLAARFDFGGQVQEDSFALDVLPREDRPAVSTKIALLDPKGLTAKLLKDQGLSYQVVGPRDDLSGFGILVIGRQALSVDGEGPDLSGVPKGLKVLVFEQDADVLANRLGFRVNVHGLRQAFARTPGHPALAGLNDELLRDWRGAATLVPPFLDIEGAEPTDPKWSWCGFQNTRVWRCGNWGNVASVLIEKPERGNFLPIVDCGFDLQYSPLLEYVEGAGRIIFCQLDVTGRTEDDPAARRLCLNLLTYLDAAKPVVARTVFYAGDARCADLLSRLQVTGEKLAGQPLDSSGLLVIGPGAEVPPKIDEGLQKGLNVLCLGLSGAELEKVLPGAKAADRPTIPSLVARFDSPALAGISNAELHWRTLLTLPVLEGVSEQSNEALRAIQEGKGRAVLCQAAPWMFDYERKPYLRTTYRRNVLLVSRLLHNLGAASQCSPLGRFPGRGEVFEYPLTGWKGLADKGDVGRKEEWFKAELDDSRWEAVRVPGTYDFLGVYWYRVRFKVPPNMKMGKDGMTLHVGAVDDESWVWLNGRLLGEVTKATNPKDYYSVPREYRIKEDMLRRDGENVLVVRVNNTYLTGGILGSPRLLTPAPWLGSYYLQTPLAGDDPYRYYRW